MLKLSVETTDIRLREEIFGFAPSFGDQSKILNGVTAESNDMNKIAAFSTIDTINILLSAAASVPASLLAQWLWDLAQKKSTKSVKLDGKEIPDQIDDIKSLVSDLHKKLAEGSDE